VTLNEERAARAVLEYIEDGFSCCSSCGNSAIRKARSLLMTDGLTVDELKVRLLEELES